MLPFNTRLNPIVPITRLLFGIALIFGGFVPIIISYVEDGFEFKIVFILIPVFMTSIGFLFMSAFIKETKTYKLDKLGLIEKNWLLNKSMTISMSEIKGYSLSIVPYQFGDVNEILIYSINQQVISLKKFNYLNYKDIQDALDKMGVRFLGTESYRWKWFNSRVYKFN
jgi:hypothetical protein